MANPIRKIRAAAIALIAATLAIAASAQAPAQTTGPLELTSALGRKLYALPDNAALLDARAAMAANPGAELALKLSLALAARRQYNEAVTVDTTALNYHPDDAALYLERGHRELGLRQFTAAQRDLEQAARLDPQMLDAHYHLGLALYFQRHFAQAAASLARARALAKTDDSLIDCSAWLFNAYRRAGNEAAAAEVLSRITPAVTNTEPHLFFYLQLLHFYQGKFTAAQILPPTPRPGDTEAELSFNTVNYGVGNWRLVNHDPAGARQLFAKVVQGEAWNAWGFVASELELSPPTAKLD